MKINVFNFRLKPLLEQQSFKCAGCGMKLEKGNFLFSVLGIEIIFEFL
jgi:hypothetical protein